MFTIGHLISQNFVELDFETITDEEKKMERDGLLLQINVLHMSMVRHLIVMMGLLLCASIFLSHGLSGLSLLQFIFAAAFGAASLVALAAYKSIDSMIKQLYTYVDKLAL